MSDTKISNPAPNWCRTCGRRPNDPMAALCLDTHHLPLERLHPQPAELAKQQEVELPPLPPVDGYDKRVHGHYSAEQMRDYARNAIRSAKQEQACSGLGIDKMAKELLERHTVAVPVAVEDGRCFMVREQDALDAICAALAATGKQQVGEAMDREQLGDLVEGMAVSVDVDGLFSTDGRRLFGTITAVQHEDGEKGGLMLLVQEPEPNWKPEQVGEVQGDAAEHIRALEAATRWSATSRPFKAALLAGAAALAARQPGADEPVSPMAKMAAALREKAAIEHTEYSQRVQSGEWGPMPEAGTQADFCRYCEGSGWDGESRKTKCPACSGTGIPVPPAQGIDLGQQRPLIARSLAEWHEDDGNVMWWAWCGRDWAGEPAWCGTPNDSDWPGYHTHWTQHPAKPALIGQRDAAPGVGNG